MKHRGSKHFLGAIGVTGSSSMFPMLHLPSSNIIQRRRRSMCQQINNTLEQMVTEESVPVYPLVFPHGLDYMSGGYIYANSVPCWWWRLANQAPPSILSLGPIVEMLPVEAELILLGMISEPAEYTQCSRAQWSCASQHWWQVVTDLHDQYLTPPRRLVWWGWHLTTNGPPTIYQPGHVYDPDGSEQVRRSIVDFGIEDEFEVEAADLNAIELSREIDTMRTLGYQSDEWVFWRAAQLALNAGIRDAEELGWPHPIAIRGSPAGFRLIFDEEDGWSNSTLSQNGSELSG